MSRFYLITFVLLLSVNGVQAADWPTFLGDGDRTPPHNKDIELVDDLQAMRQVWHTDHHMGVGKGLYPGPLRKVREEYKVKEPFLGGASSPIVADGMVYVSYYKPDGKHPANREGWRTMDKAENLALLPDWFFSVTATDRLAAFDAKTGELKWEAVEEDKGLHRVSHKRNHWCVSPAYADGLVFNRGTAGYVYAYDAKTGKQKWETLAFAHEQTAREQAIKDGKLYWDAQKASSLVVVNGLVIVADGNLVALDQKTGEIKWRTKEKGGVLGKYATPVPWEHEDKHFLLVNAGDDPGQSSVRLIDADNGNIVWTKNGLWPELGTLTVTDDIVILNVGTKKSDIKRRDGLAGAFRLTPKGLEHLWTLPDEKKYWHEWGLDRGPEKRVAARDGMLLLSTGIEKGNYLVMVELETGKILIEQYIPNSTAAPYIIEDKMLLYHDRAHSDPTVLSYWTWEKKPRRLNPTMGFNHGDISAYEVPFEIPYVDGYIYMRTLRGITCYDLRKPADDTGAFRIEFDVPNEISGRGDLEMILYGQGNKLTHGGYRGAPELHGVEIDALKLSEDGTHLTGKMKVDLFGFREPDMIDVNLKNKDGKWQGTVGVSVPAWDQPRQVEDKVEIIKHDPAWMPAADYAIQLNSANFNQPGEPKRLILLPRIKEGKVVALNAWADHTTRTPPAVADYDLKVTEDGRLIGTVAVRYRPDKWATPLVEEGKGKHVGATYQINLKLQNKPGEVGEYSGTYGVAVNATAIIK